MLARLGDLSAPDHEAIIKTLEELADPRATAPLALILESRAHPAGLREEAGALLRSLSDPPPAGALSAWWSSGDAVLERHALLQMSRYHADVVVAVATDPGHRLHREAIATMVFGFEEPLFQRLKIRALATLLEHPDERIRTSASSSLDELRSVFAETFDGRNPDEREALAAWMRPARAILGLGADASCSATPPNDTAQGRKDQPQRALSPERLVKLLSDPDGAWRDKMAHVPSARFAAHYAPARAVLVPFFSQHPDPCIRGRACGLLAAWDERGALLRMMRDSSFLVRKSAMYHLGETTVDPEIAMMSWEHLHQPETYSTHAAETLRTYVAHAPSGEAASRLAELVLHDERESVRHAAVGALTKLRATSALEPLLELLAEPPRVTWSIHIALLGASRELKLRLPRLDTLYGADNAYLQAALAPFRTS